MSNIFELIPLFSGSSGNATLVRAGKLNLLFDIGKNSKQTRIALDKVGIEASDIDAIFITHSHSDHIMGIDVFGRNFPTSVFGTDETCFAIERKFTKPHPDTPVYTIDEGKPITIGDATIHAVRTPHDSRGSCCYKIEYLNKSVAIMTDLGHVTPEIEAFAKGVDALLLESNYDRNMLIYGDYPEELKVRILGKGGHISNDECALLLSEIIPTGTRKIILGHLSENNNTRAKAYETNRDFLESKGFLEGRDYYLDVANRHEPTTKIDII